MIIRRQWRSFDFFLLIAVCGFALFGIILVGSASLNMDFSETPRILFDQIELFFTQSKMFKSQGIFFITGLVLMAVASVIDYHTIAKFYIPIYLLMLALFFILFIIGPDDSGTARWIRIGSFSLQPSEFSKLFMVVFLAKWIDKKKDTFNTILQLLLILCLIFIPTLMVAKQPSLSASMVLVAISASILFGAQLKPRYIISILLLVAAAVLFLYWDWKNPKHLVIDKILGTYQMKRLDAFAKPDVRNDNYYQVNASLHAIGSGMLNGKGFLHVSFVPESTNDFIFATLGEQFGFIGCALALGAIFFIIAKCILIANRAPDLLGRLIAIGVAGMLAFEVFINVGVVTGILPNTGMPFPFLSSGGSSMWVNMSAIGLVLNVGVYKTKSIFRGE